MRKVLACFVITSFCLSSLAQSIGSRVSFTATDGKDYFGIVKEIEGDKYLIKYDGAEFETWLLNSQFRTISATAPIDRVVPRKTNNQGRTVGNNSVNALNAIFAFGKAEGWISEIQENRYKHYIRGLTEQNKYNLLQFFKRAKTMSARFFALESLLAGDDFTVLKKFIDQLNQFPESQQQERCLVTTRKSIIQQWQYSCSVTTVQTFLGDLCPRYAWDVKLISNFDAIANDPANPMAQQQKQLLEKYGGGATPRGDYSGTSIGLLGPLNEYVGRVLGVTFYAQPATESISTTLGRIRSQLDNGIDVPLLVGFIGSNAKHFILTMKYKYSGGEYYYLIYDPWNGVCDYVSESSLVNGSLAPVLTQWKISIDYYYPTQ